MGTKEINTHCQINEEAEGILKEAVKNLNLSARAYYRILKLSRTIADLAGIAEIQTQHILEALSFRKQES
jgi:magnesium chelatase family protein